MYHFLGGFIEPAKFEACQSECLLRGLVALGESLWICRHGQPVAAVAPRIRNTDLVAVDDSSGIGQGEDSI